MTRDFSGSAFVSESLVLGDVLSSTPSGNLYHARDIFGGQPYAVKCLTNAHQRERRIYDSLVDFDHLNVQRHYFTFRRAGHTFSVMDYCEPGNSLAASIADDMFYGNDGILKGVFLQVLDAVEVCQRRGVYHRDLTPENLFLEDDGRRVVLANFARASELDTSVDCPGGDETFMSPEMLTTNGTEEYSSGLSDIWSLGVLLFAMLTGQEPWSSASTSNEEDMDENLSGFLSDPTFFMQNFLLSIEANRLLRRILVIDPNSRMSLAGIRREVTKMSTFFLSEEEMVCPRAGRRHWLHTGLNSSPSSPTLSSSDPDDQYIYSPPSVEFDPVVGFSPRPRSSLSSLPSVTTTEAPPIETPSSGLPVTSLAQDPLVYAYKIFASPTPVSTSTFPLTPTRPPLRHFAATSESGSPEDEDNKGNGFLTAEPYRPAKIYSPSSRSGSSSDRSGSSSPSSSEGCITPEDELTEYVVNAYVRSRAPPTDDGDDDDDDAELEWGRNEEVEEVVDADLPVVRLEAIKRCGGNGAVGVEEHDSSTLPMAPKSSPRMPSHGGKWPGGCESHHDGAVPGGMVGVTPKMATSHVLHYAVQMLHVFPPEPARRWM